MSKYAKRVDNNQKQVTKELRELGFSVALTHTVGKGFPDFIVGFHGINYLVELKSVNGKLTKDENLFFLSYRGQVSVHFSTQEIIEGFLKHTLILDGLREPSFVTIKLSEIFRNQK